MAEIDSASRLNAVSQENWLVCGKLMSRHILTRFNPDKKSAVQGQKIG